MAEKSRSKPSLTKALPLRFSRKEFATRRQGPVTAIDIDGDTLRVVHGAARGNRTVITRILVQRLELAPDADRTDPAVMGKAVARALEHLRAKPSQVVMGVPRASVVLRTLLLPALADVPELASMVHFQISKDLPFRLSEAVVDFRVRRQVIPPPEAAGEDKPAETKTTGEAASPSAPPPSKVEVLAAAVKREVVDFYAKTAAIAGVKLTGLGLISHANARCVEACRLAENSEAVAIVTLRPDRIGIDVVAQQLLFFSRGAAVKLGGDESAPSSPPAPEPPLPAAEPDQGAAAAGAPEPAEPSSEAPTEPEQQEKTYVEAVTIEVVRSLHSYGGMETQMPVARVVVAGATGHEKAVVEALQERLNMPCRVLDVVGALELPKAAREHAPGSISAIGLCLAANDPPGLPCDFLHPKQPRVPRNTRRIVIISSLAAAAVLVISVVAARLYLVKEREKTRSAVQAELAEAKKKHPIYRAMRLQTTALQDWVQGGRNWLDHYAYLSAILPPSEEIYITSFSVSGQGTIRLSVQARSGEILAKVEKALRTAGYEVKPVAINPGSDKYGYDFRSSVELVVPDKMKIDLTQVKPPPRPEDDVSLDPAYRKGGGS